MYGTNREEHLDEQLSKAEILSGGGSYRIVRTDIGSYDVRSRHYLAYVGKMKFGGARRTNTAHAVTNGNDLPDVTIQIPDVATLSDGRQADIRITFSDVHVELTQTYPVNGTSADDYPSMVILIKDIDAADYLNKYALISSNTAAEVEARYNGDYAEHVELAENWFDPVVLAKNSSDPINTSLLKYFVRGNNMFIRGDGRKYYATGSLGDITKQFAFTVTIKGLPAGFEGQTENSGAITDMGFDGDTFEADASGAAILKFRLKDDASVKFTDLPEGAKCEVIEAESDHDPSYFLRREDAVIRSERLNMHGALSTGEIGIGEGEDITAEFTNNREIAPNTGSVHGGSDGPVTASVALLALMALMLSWKLRRNRAE